MQGIRTEGHKAVFFEVEDMGGVKVSAIGGHTICLEVSPDGYLLNLDEAEEMAGKMLAVVKALRDA